MSAHRTSQMVSELLNNKRRMENSNLSPGRFVATLAKGYRYSVLAVAILGIGMNAMNWNELG